MDEVVRRIGVDNAMEVVIGQVHARKLVPAVLLAVSTDGEALAVLPCGPGVPRERVRELLQQAAAAAWVSPNGEGGP